MDDAAAIPAKPDRNDEKNPDADIYRTQRGCAPVAHTNENARFYAHHTVVEETGFHHEILKLHDPPTIRLRGPRVAVSNFAPGELLSMKKDYAASMSMRDFLDQELTGRLGFENYEVCDVGFWVLEASSDTGFGWHHDNNWNSFLRPDNRTYHGWFVYSFTEDCNTTLAVSTECKYNQCNTNELLGITGIQNDDVIKPDVIAPLRKNCVTLFPVGSLHRTYRFKDPETLAGHRVCVSFILHHKTDKLNDEKLAKLTDDEMRQVFDRYGIEKALETGHYMIGLLEDNPRTAPLVSFLAV